MAAFDEHSRHLRRQQQQQQQQQQQRRRRQRRDSGDGVDFNSHSHPRTSAADEGPGAVRRVGGHGGHWLLKERVPPNAASAAQGDVDQIQSMPPMTGVASPPATAAAADTLRDSGFGEEKGQQQQQHLSRNGTGR